jgi:hypothetical protein
MNIDNAIIIRTFVDDVAAQMASIELKAHGIESVVNADDCGGAIPAMHVGPGVALLIDPASRQQAEKILSTLEANDKAQEGLSEDYRWAPRPTRFLPGLLLGLLIGGAVFFIWRRHTVKYTGTRQYDYNHDNTPDAVWSFKNGVAVDGQEDRNFDGEPDIWYHYRYRDGRLANVQADQNFDGEVDGWWSYSNAVVTSARADTDFNGVVDVQSSFRNGVLDTAEWHPNGSKVMSARETYKNGLLRLQWIDEDLDGRFDVKKTYDAMGKEIGSIQLTNPVQNQ